MSETVLSSVREKCREALKAHIPIVYIKTDSSIFIQRLLESSPAMVARVWSEHKGKQYESELIKPGEKFNILPDSVAKNDVGNYSHETDKRKGIHQSVDKVITIGNAKIPFVKAYQIPEKANITGLEEYIIRHEKSNDEYYDVYQNSLVILYSSQVYLDENLLPYTNIIEVGYPKEDEIKATIVSESDNYFDYDDADNYSGALLGLNAEEVAMLTKRMVVSGYTNSPEDLEKRKSLIYDYKKQKMEGGCLKFCKTATEEIGGMELYEEWLKENAEPIIAWHEYEKKYGTPPPKGVLFCGIPGCGKSAAAKFTAQRLGLTLVKLDIGTLMDKFQGEAERKMRDALELAESIAPCVLWIDELEKGFSGAGGNEDSSSFKRMFGYLLGWMQDNKKPCFIFATANNIGGLPKEFFRTGRMDERFAVYLPLEENCISIFKAVMSNYKLPDFCKKDSLLKNVIKEKLIDNGKPKIVIGSDIEEAVKIALRKLNGREITDKNWEEELKNAFDSFTVYGDSEENIDSIAVSYCRLLRKGMRPTTENVLFNCKDYDVNNYSKLKEIKMQKATLSENEYAQKINNNRILQSNYRSGSEYNNLVHAVLEERINSVAYDIEEYERKILIRV